MARFFIVTINYAPEPSGFAPYAAAFAEYLGRRGHQVDVFTGFPFAPQWRRREQDRGRLFARERSGNVTVHRLLHFIPRRPSSAAQRVLMEGTFGLGAFGAMLGSGSRRARRPDAIIYIGAQPALAMAARIFASLVRRPYFVRITDLAARAALDVGIVGRRLSRVLDRFEFAAYAKATAAMVLCRSFEETLRGHGYPGDRIAVIANPIDMTQIRPVPRNNRFRDRYGIPKEGFVILHAGSMGLKQGLLTVIAAADQTRETGIHWVFVGDGEVRRQLVQAVQERRLEKTVHFVPFQPESEMSEMFADADLLLVNQIRAVKDTLIPGKIHVYMAAGRPILLAANSSSQAAQVLREAGGGLLVAPEDADALAKAARDFQRAGDASLAEFGARSRVYAEAHLDEKRVLPAQEAFMLECIERRTRTASPDAATS